MTIRPRNSSARPTARTSPISTVGTGVWEAAITSPDTALGPFERYERFQVTGAAN